MSEAKGLSKGSVVEVKPGSVGSMEPHHIVIRGRNDDPVVI